jgi:hypothetical protein
VRALPLARQLLDASPEPVLVLNESWQILLLNERAEALAGRPRRHSAGHRPGDLLGCLYANGPVEALEPFGCGTAAECRLCGLGRALSECQREGRPAEQEGRLQRATAGRTGTTELRASARPLRIGGRRFMLLGLRDVGQRRRGERLERRLFQDVLATARALRDMTRLWPLLETTEALDMQDRLRRLTELLVDQVEAERRPRGRLGPTPVPRPA